ncbi:MAG: hypothetical protein KDE27_06390 [Planctomycetes bacterium]|nr:hypothetical protein [Planctomycetota bacterium]
MSKMLLESPFRSLAVLIVLCMVSGCGPALIGTGIASIGGPGSDGIASPTVSSAAVARQPLADGTVVGLTVAQADGRAVRLRLETDIGSGPQPVDAAHVAHVTDPELLTPGTAEFDAAGNVVLPASPNGTTHYLLWDHRGQFGTVEVPGVTLSVVFADAAATQQDGLVASASNRVELHREQTFGRELGELTDVAVSRVNPTDPESPLRISATLLDRGGDEPITEFGLRYATTSAMPSPADWVAIPEPTVRQVSAPTIAPDGRVRVDVDLILDVYDPAVALPFGAFDAFWIELTAREDYVDFRRPLGALAVSDPILRSFGALDIGWRPEILSVSVADPGLNVAGNADYGRVFLKLPIALKVRNPSQRAMHVRLAGDYRIDGGSPRAMTAFDSELPEGRLEFDLEPGETSSRFFVWNVVADEGLGISVEDAQPNNPKLRAEVIMVAEAVLPNGPGPNAAPLSTRFEDNRFTTLSTQPFVGFRENLLRSAQRVYSSGIDAEAEARDIVYTIRPDTIPAGGSRSQEFLIDISQQFEPRQLVPPPPVFDFDPLSGVQNGVYDIVPTDFVPANENGSVPDCLAWVSDRFFTVEWLTGGVPPVVTDIGTASGGSRRGRVPSFFRLGSGSSEQFVTVFFTYSEMVVSGGKQVDLSLITVSRDAAGQWTVTPRPAEPFQLPDQAAGPVAVAPIPMLLELDGDPATREIAFLNQGAEYQVAGRPGLLHYYSFGLVGGDVAVVAGPTLLPAPLLPVGNPDREVEIWRFEPWREPGAADGIVMVRQLRAIGQLPREFDVHVYRQPAAGTLGTWQLETVLTPPQNVIAGNLEELYAADLDGQADGILGPDLMLTFTHKYANSSWPTENSQDLHVWLYAARSNQAPVWRELLAHVAAQDPDTGQTYPNEVGRVYETRLVDVNGDRFLDLLTGEEDITFMPNSQTGLSRPRFWNYFASSMSGVAGGLADLGLPPVRLPGNLDANADGHEDFIADSVLYLGSALGSFAGNVGGFGGGNDASYIVGRIFADTPVDATDVLGYSATAGCRIVRLGGLGAAPFTTTTLADPDFGQAVALVRPLTAPDTASREAVDLVALTNAGTLLRGRFSGGAFAATPLTLTGNVAAWVPGGLALCRREALSESLDPLVSTAVEDVVAVPQNRDAVVVFQSHDDYQPLQIDMPAGQQVVRIAAGSCDGDRYDDLLVLTVQGDLWRVLSYAQDPAPTVGFGGGAMPREFMRFTAPFPGAEARSFAFDRRATRLAEGFLLFDEAGSSNRGEVRFILPVVAADQYVRLVRSPVQNDIPTDFGSIVTDVDADGLVEVIGGQTDGVRRVQRNLR